MPFQALTGAPMLRDGVLLNIMAYPQAEGIAPQGLVAGALLTVRFGNCCPMVKEGRITAVDADPERVVLVLDGTTWMLEPAASCIAVPGIMSRDWIVRAAAP